MANISSKDMNNGPRSIRFDLLVALGEKPAAAAAAGLLLYVSSLYSKAPVYFSDGRNPTCD